MSGSAKREPFAARLHFIPRAIARVQRVVVRLLRRYFERAPGWVLVTTRGRKTGLPRQVLLPCERFDDAMIVISTYGWRSHWIRNMRKNPRVQVTCAGWKLDGTAEIVDDAGAKRDIVSAHPFFPVAPLAIFHIVLRTVLRPLLVVWLRWWVTARPIVVIRREGGLRQE